MRAMSPVLSNLAEAVRGQELARVMAVPGFFSDRHRVFADEFNKCNYHQFGECFGFGEQLSPHLRTNLESF